MKFILVFSLVFLSACSQELVPATGQQDLAIQLRSLVESHRVTTWKYNAKGAYSIIFDDYCMKADGIQTHAAPEAEKRGLVIGFGVVTGACDDNEWLRAREMIAAGHEVINHSHTHRCGELRTPWCTDVWSDADIQEEIDQPTNLIYSHTGVRPTFFIFPFDLFTAGKVEHLRHAGYLGTRTGEKRRLTAADFTDPFSQLNFDVKFPPESAQDQKYGLNEYVDEAIAKGQLAFREVHGVEDESWGRLPLGELRDHFDYVQTRVKSYDLWMATISNIIRYNQARRSCKLDSGIDAIGAWIRLTGDAPECSSGIELSLVFNRSKNLELLDHTGVKVGQINGTYTLSTGKIYRIAGQ